MLKVMFIDAVNYEKYGETETFLPTLGLGYLASSLRKEFGHNHIEIKIVQRDIEQEISKFGPDIVGITSVSKNYNRAIRYARIAKEYGLPVIMGGMHISLLASTLTSDMDVGVIGEGEETVVDLVKLFCDKGNFDWNELENIDGVAFKRDDKLIVTNKRKLIEPLDSVPMPARDLFTINEFTYMFTSRGCPYRCTFCSSTRFWDKVRLFSAEYVVNEIEYLIKEHNVRKIGLWDDLFIVSKARVRQIADLLEKKDILGKVSFHIEARSNLVDNELAQLLKQMNVTEVSMGLESGCPTTLEYLKGRDVSIDDHINAINILRNHGIKPGGSFIIGSPKESREDILQTLRFIKENQLAANFMVFVLTPFPGTPVWDYAKSRDLVSDDMDWDALDVSLDSGKEKAVILSENLTRDQIYELFLMFGKERVKIMFRKGQLKVLSKETIRVALRNPLMIPGALLSAFMARVLRRNMI